MLAINCDDGARHEKTSKIDTNILTSSLCCICKDLVNVHDVKPSDQKQMLTIAQANVKEECNNFFHLKKQFHETASDPDTLSMFPEDADVVWAHLHDGKHLHMILQHSVWNRTHKPFLHCKCRRGESVVCSEDKDFKCKMMKQEEHRDHCNLSIDKLNEKNWSEAKHQDWCDQHNQGITHYGISPDIFNVENICFDVFHLRSSITRTLLHYF